MVTRRQFAGRVLGVPLLVALGRRGLEAGLPPEQARRSALPVGEMADRIRLTAQRLAQGVPSFDDLEGCGLYLGAVSLLPPGGTDQGPFARDLLRLQQADGRFGDPELRIGTGADGARLEALLRTNGRILVGLLEHAESSGDAKALAAAVRLGAFAQEAIGAASDARVAAHLAATDGLASLTQLAEGLVLLAEASGERRFQETARSLRPLFGARDQRAAADYLASMRGLLALATATSDSALLRDVEARYRDLSSSVDVTAMGEVPRVFGRAGPPDLAAGAELLRVSLQLWDATAGTEALDRAERSLWNHVFASQRNDGDFEAPTLDGGAPRVLATSETETVAGRRGTLYGYRAFRDVLDHLARHDDQTAFTELLLDADLTEPGFVLALRHTVEGPGSSRLALEVLDAGPGPQGLALRKPSWATVSLVLFDGSRVMARPGPYLTLLRRWRAGETIEMLLEHLVRLETRDRRSVAPAALTTPTEAALFVGPWLMAADEAQSPALFAGPGPAARTVLLPPSLAQSGASEGGPPFTDRARHLRLRYRTEGTTDIGLVTLAPLSEATGRAPGRLAAWLRYERAD